MSLSANFLPKKFSRANTKRIIHNELRHSKTNRLREEAMNNERVTPKNAAKELQMDVITLRELMKREKLPIGYAIKREGKSKWGFYIYRHLLDQEKERLGIG